MNVWPATGMNCQEYVPSPSVSLSTPGTPDLRTSLFGWAAVTELVPIPPVPTVNCRIPRCGSSTPAGLCGAKRSYSS